MLKITCQLSLTLDIPTAQHIERIAHDAYLGPGGVGRTLLLQRLALESAGWKVGDNDLGRLLEAVCRLPKDGVEELAEAIRRLDAQDEPTG